MATDEEYEVEMVGTREDVAIVLTEVARGIRDGTVRLDDGMEAVTVEFPDELTLETELETDGDEVSLELEMEWPASEVSGGTSADEVTSDEITEEPAVVVPDEADEGAADPIPDSVDDGPNSLAEFEVFRDGGREWRWRLRHQNGNIIATSGDGYSRKRGALAGLRSVVENTPGADVREEIAE